MNLAMLGSNSLLGAQANQQGFGLGALAQMNPLADIDLSHVSAALPYIAAGTAGAAAVGLASIFAIRIWRRRQEALPPPGMKDIRPEEMQAFFDRHAKDAAENTDVLMGFNTLALSTSLEETARVVASEKAQLAAALKTSKDAKNRKVLEGFLQACEQLEVLVSLRRGNVTRASTKWLTNADQLHEKILSNLGHLRRYRIETADRFFQKVYAGRATEMPDCDATPEIAARYVALSKGEKTHLYSAAISVWQSLSDEDRDFFWDLLTDADRTLGYHRGPVLPPDFLTLFARLVPQPTFPLARQAMIKHLPVLMAKQLETWREQTKLPGFLKDSENALVFVRSQTSGLNAKVTVARKPFGAEVILDYETSEKVQGSDELKKITRHNVLSVPSLLTIRDAEQVDPAIQEAWTHPSVSLKEIGMVTDLSIKPALSLGEGHHVLVDYLDPEITNIFEDVKKIWAKIDALDNKNKDSVSIAEALWRFLQKKVGVDQPERLVQKAGPGRLHSLGDMVRGTGEVEFAILMQMIYQFMGIPSRLEQGNVDMKFPHGRHLKDGKGPVPVLWVRLMVPGRRERILCGRLSGPIFQGDPEFDRFSDQTPGSGPHSQPQGGLPGASMVVPLSMIPPPPAVPTGVVQTNPSEDDVTPIPGPVPPPSDDAPDEADQSRIPTRMVPAAAFAGGPQVSVDEDAFDRKTVVTLNPINFQAMKKGLDAELAERYTLLSDKSPTSAFFIQSLREKIVEAWQNAGQPSLEYDDNGVAARMPENFISDTVARWLEEFRRNSSDVAQQIISQWVDAGNRAARQRKKLEKTTVPPASAERQRATPPPLPATEPRPAVPPPPPEISAEERQRAEAEKREARLLELAQDALEARYPSFREPSQHSLAVTLSKKIRKASGGDESKMVAAAEEFVAKTAALMKQHPEHENSLRLVRGADAIYNELAERYPIFLEDEWEPLRLQALGEIFHLWQIRHSQWEQWAGENVVPEKVFEEGFSNFTSQLTTNYPETDPDVFHQVFIEQDQGSRDKRYEAPEAELEMDAPEPAPMVAPKVASPEPTPAVTDVSSVRERMVTLAPEKAAARIRELYPPLAASETALQSFAAKVVAKESDPDFDLDRTIHRLTSVLIRSMVDNARVGTQTPLEQRLKALIEASVASELRERYSLFRQSSYDAAVAGIASRVFDIWTSHNRTFNGSADAIPLRVPEKFITEAMDKLIRSLRGKNPQMAGDIVGSFTGYRADREKAKREPSAPPAAPAIPISEATIYIELKDRFRQFALDNESLVRVLAKTIYKNWLQDDPARDGEKNSMGRRGLVPEVYLEAALRDLHARLAKKGMKDVRAAMDANDRGPRGKRGTQLVEFDIQEEVARAS